MDRDDVLLAVDYSSLNYKDGLAITGKGKIVRQFPFVPGVDLAEVKKRAGNRACLIGNVNCALLQTGRDDEVVDDVRRALRQGMPGGGYVFGTSNCIYTGMRLSRYELMLDVWRREGIYDAADSPGS